jgi:hypothetical protein
MEITQHNNTKKGQREGAAKQKQKFKTQERQEARGACIENSLQRSSDKRLSVLISMSACVIPHMHAVFAKKCAFEKFECMLQ